MFFPHHPPPTPTSSADFNRPVLWSCFCVGHGWPPYCQTCGHLLSWSCSLSCDLAQLCPPVFLMHLAPWLPWTSHTWLFLHLAPLASVFTFLFLSVSFHSLPVEDSTASYSFSLLLCLSSEVVSSKLMALNLYALYIWPDTHLEFQVHGLPLIYK